MTTDQHYDLRILRALRQITRSIALHSRQLSAYSNITAPQLICLRTIIEKGPLTATAISREMHVSPSTVVGILDRLEWRYLQHEDAQLQAPRWQVEEGPTINRSQLRLRLHRQLAGRLEVFNAAIRSLQADGTLARIVARYAPKAHVVGQVEIR